MFIYFIPYVQYQLKRTILIFFLLPFSKDHEVAAQMKLLADAPEQIWQCLEGQSYLKAAQYFLLSRHIFSRLELSGAGSSVVKKLWHSVSSFKETIMEVGMQYCP